MNLKRSRNRSKGKEKWTVLHIESNHSYEEEVIDFYYITITNTHVLTLSCISFPMERFMNLGNSHLGQECLLLFSSHRLKGTLLANFMTSTLPASFRKQLSDHLEMLNQDLQERNLTFWGILSPPGHLEPEPTCLH